MPDPNDNDYINQYNKKQEEKEKNEHNLNKK